MHMYPPLLLQLHSQSIHGAGCSSHVSTEVFERLCSRLMAQIKTVCQRALQAAGLQPWEVHGVERVGGASRTPAILQVIREVFSLDKGPSRYALL